MEEGVSGTVDSSFWFQKNSHSHWNIECSGLDPKIIWGWGGGGGYFSRIWENAFTNFDIFFPHFFCNKIKVTWIVVSDALQTQATNLWTNSFPVAAVVWKCRANLHEVNQWGSACFLSLWFWQEVFTSLAIQGIPKWFYGQRCGILLGPELFWKNQVIGCQGWRNLRNWPAKALTFWVNVS